jgi:hypothetical protein
MDVSEMDPCSLRRQISFLPQNPSLFRGVNGGLEPASFLSQVCHKVPYACVLRFPRVRSVCTERSKGGQMCAIWAKNQCTRSRFMLLKDNINY